MKSTIAILLAAGIGGATAQSPAYGQCGGQGVWSLFCRLINICLHYYSGLDLPAVYLASRVNSLMIGTRNVFPALAVAAAAATQQRQPEQQHELRPERPHELLRQLRMEVGVQVEAVSLQCSLTQLGQPHFQLHELSLEASMEVW